MFIRKHVDSPRARHCSQNYKSLSEFTTHIAAHRRENGGSEEARERAQGRDGPPPQPGGCLCVRAEDPNQGKLEATISTSARVSKPPAENASPMRRGEEGPLPPSGLCTACFQNTRHLALCGGNTKLPCVLLQRVPGLAYFPTLI